MRSAVLSDRSQFFRDLSGPFYAANRPDAQVSHGVRETFWMQGMQAGFKSVIDCIKAFSETDQTEDLKKIDVPTLIMHGDDDQILPIGASAILSAKLIKNSTLKVYPAFPTACAPSTKIRSTRICWLSSRRRDVRQHPCASDSTRRPTRQDE